MAIASSTGTELIRRSYGDVSCRLLFVDISILSFSAGVIIPLGVGCAVFGAYQGYAQKMHRQTEKFEDTDVLNSVQPFLTAERDRE